MKTISLGTDVLFGRKTPADGARDVLALLDSLQ